MPTTKAKTRRSDPYKNFNFRVKIDGTYVAGASRIKPKARREEPALAAASRSAYKKIIGQLNRPKTRGSKAVPGPTALFVGPKGTGKILAAEVIAGQLGTQLLRVNLSKVVSKYIGETEKNIARVFAAADDVGAVLFFDEADALFARRTNVRDSHDRYANIEIGYFFRRLEDYGGLAILATNRRKDIDAAFRRRLRYTFEFAAPK